MEIQQIDLGAYKSNLGRLEVKYNDVLAQLDEANDEVVMRESGIEATQSAILDLRSQIDRLNGDFAEAESATAKAEAERNHIQLLFNESTRSVQLMQRENDDSRAEVERLRAADTARDTARDTEIGRLRSEGVASQQTIVLLRRQLDSST